MRIEVKQRVIAETYGDPSCNCDKNRLVAGGTPATFPRPFTANKTIIAVNLRWVDSLDRIAHLQERMGLLDVLFATTGIVPLARALGDRKTTTLSFFPNITDASIETGRAFNIEHPLHDLVFFGRLTPERQMLCQVLSSLSKTLKGFIRSAS